MKQIDEYILQKLSGGKFLFNYPIIGNTIENYFELKETEDYKKFIYIRKEEGCLVLSDVSTFTHEKDDIITKISNEEILNGKWWISL